MTSEHPTIETLKRAARAPRVDTELVPHFVPPLGGPSNKAVKLAYKVIEQRNAAVDAQKRATLVICQSQTATGRGCGQTMPIAELTYIQDHYEAGSNSDWYTGEGGFKCLHCGKHNRLYASPALTELKPYFKDVRKTYAGRDHG